MCRPITVLVCLFKKVLKCFFFNDSFSVGLYMYIIIVLIVCIFNSFAHMFNHFV